MYNHLTLMRAGIDPNATRQQSAEQMPVRCRRKCHWVALMTVCPCVCYGTACLYLIKRPMPVLASLRTPSSHPHHPLAMLLEHLEISMSSTLIFVALLAALALSLIIRGHSNLPHIAGPPSPSWIFGGLSIILLIDD
jgi:hypothetical protein